MSTQRHENMNPVRLFSLLSDLRSERDEHPLEFNQVAYEYLLRFCEVNRSSLIDRIDKECLERPTPMLIRQMATLLLKKWVMERDYRYLNLLYKFRKNSYFSYFPKDELSRNLRIQLEQTLNREIKYE